MFEYACLDMYDMCRCIYGEDMIKRGVLGLETLGGFGWLFIYANGMDGIGSRVYGCIGCVYEIKGLNRRDLDR